MSAVAAALVAAPFALVARAFADAIGLEGQPLDLYSVAAFVGALALSLACQHSENHHAT